MAVNEAEILRNLGIGIEKSEDAINGGVIVSITAWSKDKIKIVQDILRKRGTGAASQSVTPLPIKQTGDLFAIVITADEYVPFLEEGVNGLFQQWGSSFSFKNLFPSRAMIEGIKDWNKTTGRTVPNTQFPHIKNYDQLAFATAINVKKHGIEPSPFMEKAFGKQSEADLAKVLEKALGKTIDVYFAGIAKKYKK